MQKGQPKRNYVTILQLLIAPKLKAIEAERTPSDLVLTITPRLRRLQAEYVRHLARARKVEVQLERLGADIERHADHSLSVPYQKQREYKALHAYKQAQRVEKINKLKAKAMVDLLDIDAKRAQTYLRKVERELARI